MNCGPSTSNSIAFVRMRSLPNSHRVVKRKSDLMHYLDRRIQDRHPAHFELERREFGFVLHVSSIRRFLLTWRRRTHDVQRSTQPHRPAKPGVKRTIPWNYFEMLFTPRCCWRLPLAWLRPTETLWRSSRFRLSWQGIPSRLDATLSRR